MEGKIMDGCNGKLECGNCGHSHCHGPALLCRRKSPLAVAVVKSTPALAGLSTAPQIEVQTFWPIVTAEMSCGEFEVKPTMAN
jgi:hypothetical protein